MSHNFLLYGAPPITQEPQFWNMINICTKYRFDSYKYTVCTFNINKLYLDINFKSSVFDNSGENAPSLHLTQIDNQLRNCVHEIFVIAARL